MFLDSSRRDLPADEVSAGQGSVQSGFEIRKNCAFSNIFSGIVLFQKIVLFLYSYPGHRRRPSRVEPLAQPEFRHLPGGWHQGKDNSRKATEWSWFQLSVFWRQPPGKCEKSGSPQGRIPGAFFHLGWCIRKGQIIGNGQFPQKIKKISGHALCKRAWRALGSVGARGGR